MTVLPELVAVNVVIPEVPPIVSVAFDAWVKPPVPLSAVLTVRSLLLVRTVGTLTVTLGMTNEPVSAWIALVLNVCTPVPAVKVPEFVIPPRKTTTSFPELFQVPPAFTVTRPSNLLPPGVEEIIKLPLVPPPTVVVPFTIMPKAGIVNDVPSPIDRSPFIVRPITVVVVAVPLKTKSPPITVVAV